MDYFSIFIQMLQAKGVTDNTRRSYGEIAGKRNYVIFSASGRNIDEG